MDKIARIALGICGLGIVFISVSQLVLGGDWVFILATFGAAGIIMFAARPN